MVAILGLLPIGVNSNQTSIQQTSAANLAKAVASDLRVTPAASGTNSYATSPVYGFQIPAPGYNSTVPSCQTVFFAESGNPTGAMGAIPATGAATSPDTMETTLSRFRVSVSFTAPAATGQKTATVAYIIVTWPALADPTPGNPPANYSGAYETVTALNRN